MKTIKYTAAKKTFWATLTFYLLIGFEFIYMASPFAAYFYSVYRPGLEFLDNYPSIAWVTGFFLPHLVEDTKSSWINILKPAGAIIASTGLLIFIICAVQVYYAKLFKKGIVKGGLYKYIRHPQYSAFIVCSFGLLILWPRYLVLIMFISLLFVYYFLAMAEEKECETKFGESYINYKNSTGMFIPVKLPSFNIINYNPGKTGKTILTVFLYLFLVISSIQIADELKKNSINSLYTINSGRRIFISIFKKDTSELKKIRSIIETYEPVSSILEKNAGLKYVNYVLPADMYLSEVPMVKLLNEKNHMIETEYSSTQIKVIVTEAIIKNSKGKESNNILSNVISLNPVAEVWIDLISDKIIKSVKLNNSNIRYKNIPEPVF